MKSPVEIFRSKQEVNLKCTDCGVIYVACVADSVAPEQWAFGLKKEVDLCKRERCRCELRGDISDLQYGMSVKRTSGDGPEMGIICALWRDEDFLEFFEYPGNRYPAKNYRPDWA